MCALVQRRIRRGRCPRRPVRAVFGLPVFSAAAGVTPSGGLFFPLVRKEEEERHAKGKGFLQSRPSLWNPILRSLFASRALRCRARCLAPLGPRNRGAAGNVGGRPAWNLGLLIRGNHPICHSERSEESGCKLALRFFVAGAPQNDKRGGYARKTTPFVILSEAIPKFFTFRLSPFIFHPSRLAFPESYRF